MKLNKHAANPILKPNPENDWEDCCVLNPAVIYDDARNKFVMLYRAAGNDFAHVIRLGLAESDDGVNFTRVYDKPVMEAEPNHPDGGALEDPRIVKLDGRYFITYVAEAYSPGKYWLPDQMRKYRNEFFPKNLQTLPALVRDFTSVTYLAFTDDFKTFKRLGRITDSRYDDRDVVLFPEKVNGKYVRISRPKRDDKAPSVWITYSDDLLEWGEPTKFIEPKEWWEELKVGASCPPIRTKDGWLFVYHGVDAKNEIYRVGFAMLDINHPEKVIARTKNFVMEPEYDYETQGLYNGCVFPTGIVEKGGVFYIYYGCADRFIGLATVGVNEVLEELRKPENQVSNA